LGLLTPLLSREAGALFGQVGRDIVAPPSASRIRIRLRTGRRLLDAVSLSQDFPIVKSLLLTI
jgi:hypothetical protein